MNWAGETLQWGNMFTPEFLIFAYMTTQNIVNVTDDSYCGPREQSTLRTKYGLFIHPVNADHPQNDAFAMITIVTEYNSFSYSTTEFVTTPAQLEAFVKQQIETWNNEDHSIAVSPQSLTVRVHPSIITECDVESVLEPLV